MKRARKSNVSDKERPEVLERVELIVLLRHVLLIDGAHDVQSTLLQNVTEVDEWESVGRRSVEKNRRTPVFGMILIEVELEKHFSDLMEDERLRDIAPLLLRGRVEQVDKDNDQDEDRNESFPSDEAER